MEFEGYGFWPLKDKGLINLALMHLDKWDKTALVKSSTHTWYFTNQMMRSEHHPNFISKYSQLMLGTPWKRNF